MYVVGGDEYDKISYELFTHHQKAQHPRWPPISVKKTFMTLNDINDMSLFEHLFVVAILENNVILTMFTRDMPLATYFNRQRIKIYRKIWFQRVLWVAVGCGCGGRGLRVL